MIKNLISIFLASILIIGCGKPAPNIEECLHIAKLTPVKKYKIIKSDTLSAIGDYYLSHTLIISKGDYLKLVNEIRSKSYFLEYDAPASIRHARIYADRMDLNFVEVAYSIQNETYYEYFKREKWEEIRISLYNDSLLSIVYDQD